MKPLLIGQAPGPNTDPDYPLFPVPRTSAGGRLQELMGLSRGEYLKAFDFVNVLRHFPGKHKRDDKFPMPLARAAADAMRPLLAGRRVILIGRNVASAFGLDEVDWHAWYEVKVRRRCLVSKTPWTASMAVAPHPSGRSRWYNEADNRAQARQFWNRLLSEQNMEGGLSLSLPSVPGQGTDTALAADAA
jgi:hypothetical protein